VRQRYERLFKAREREDDSPRAAAAAASEALAADTAARTAFQGAISAAFAPHLGRAPAARPRPLAHARRAAGASVTPQRGPLQRLACRGGGDVESAHARAACTWRPRSAR